MNSIARKLFKIAGSLSSAGIEAYRNDYDLRAEKYDSAETRPILRAVTEELLAQVDLRSGMHCIDLGCGTGHASRIIAARVQPAGHVIGCDFSSGMLSVAENTDGMVQPGLQFLKRDMLEFLGDCEGNAADFIGAFWSADYCNLNKLFSELKRVLKPGGTVAILINTQESLKELQRIIVPILLKHPYFIKHMPPINFPPDMEGFKKYIFRYGFTIQQLEEETRVYSFSSGQKVVTWMKESGPAAGVIGSLRGNYLDNFFNCIEAAVDKQGGLTITFRYLIFVGRKWPAKF